MGAGLVAALAGTALPFAVMAFAGVQLARGRWERVLAGSSEMNDEEIRAACPPEARRVIGVFLLLAALFAGAFAEFSVAGAYEEGADALFTVLGVGAALLGAFFAWAVSVGLKEGGGR